jgi:hypothetical protein
MESRQFAGYEPFDLLNSPWLAGRWARNPLAAVMITQFGKRFAGVQTRQALRVPPSRNPKALGLCLVAYCDLARAGYDVAAQIAWLKGELVRLRSTHEADYCWGYDWDYISLRGSRLRAFAPNAIATYFCGAAMLRLYDLLRNPEDLAIAQSVGRFFATRLNRSFASTAELCFSYTPDDRTVIYNSSALVGSFLARIGGPENLALARKAMAFLVRAQLPNGGWYYGALRRQRWIDSFHTSYNVCALLDYQAASGDPEFEEAMHRGDRYYRNTFFTAEGVPRYFHNQTYPIDIHACSQAILHFSAFGGTTKPFEWTMKHMAAPDGSFYYQRHRWWTNRTPYMRWGQAWMLRALASLLKS